jgi:hypothetical protein
VANIYYFSSFSSDLILFNYLILINIRENYTYSLTAVSSKRVLVNLVVKVLDRRSRVKINSGASVSWDPLSSPNIYTATTMPRASETDSFKASRISWCSVFYHLSVGNQFNHTMLRVKDPKVSLAFYQDVRFKPLRCSWTYTWNHLDHRNGPHFWYNS